MLFSAQTLPQKGAEPGPLAELNPQRRLICEWEKWDLAHHIPTPGPAGGGGEPSGPHPPPGAPQQVLEVPSVELGGQPPPRKPLTPLPSFPCPCVYLCPTYPVLFPGAGAGCEENHPGPPRVPCCPSPAAALQSLWHRSVRTDARSHVLENRPRYAELGGDHVLLTVTL